jgi:serine/threonine protein kinase/regulation of enolase protein 1 (concanavalin A-like superfamily)
MMLNCVDSQTPSPSHNRFPREFDPRDTASYYPETGSSSSETTKIRRDSSARGFDFLSAPRASGELGWLGHYRVLELVGEGGMGLVFRAEDSLLSRPVALKVIRPELAHNPVVAERFSREARATAAITNDHIVRIYQVGRENGVPYLAMEYLRGMSLAGWLDRGHKPSVEVMLRVGREIAAGLSAAHKVGLIHRDIKPANIWLEAPWGRVKIVDFGMARSEREDVEITRSGAVMGSPAYMAPEQARGETVVASSDLFSLGCVLYRLATSRLPFDGDSVMAVLTSISTETPVPPLDLNDTIPAGLSDLIMRLLHKIPEARPVSAEAVVKELRVLERALHSDRRSAEFPAPGQPPTMDAVAIGSQSPHTSAPATGSSGMATGRRARWRAVTVAAVLTVLAGTATIVFVSASHRGAESEARIAAAVPAARAPEPAPPATNTERAIGSADRPGSPRVPDVEAKPVELATIDVPRAGLTMERDLAPAAKALPPVKSSGGKITTEASETEATKANTTVSEVVRDARLVPENPHWGDAIDPDRDSQFDLVSHERTLRIAIPGKSHILSAEIGRVNAPRVLREIKGDFDITVRVAGATHPGGKPTTSAYPPYHGGGLLIWQDPDNYIRLEIAADFQHGKVRPYVNFEQRKDGLLASSSGILNPDGSSFLRIKRRGEEIYASFGPDRFRWTAFAPLAAKLSDRLMVGVVAINSATKPLTVEFDGLEVLERPAQGADPKADIPKP